MSAGAGSKQWRVLSLLSRTLSPPKTSGPSLRLRTRRDGGIADSCFPSRPFALFAPSRSHFLRDSRGRLGLADHVYCGASRAVVVRKGADLLEPTALVQ